MTTEVPIKLYGDVERAVWTWSGVAGCDPAQLLTTIVCERMAAWDKALPKTVKELRAEFGTQQGG